MVKIGKDEDERNYVRFKNAHKAMKTMFEYTMKKRAKDILLIFLEDINKIQNCMIKMRVFNLDVQSI